MRKIVVRWLDSQGRPRLTKIPIWIVLLPPSIFVVLGLALQALWHSPWSPQQLGTKLDDIQSENARMERHLERIQQGVDNAQEALTFYDKDSALYRDLAAIANDSARGMRQQNDGLLGRLFGSNEKVPDIQKMLTHARSLRSESERVVRWLSEHPSEAASLPVVRPVRGNAPVVITPGKAKDPFTGLVIPVQGVAWGVPVGTPVWATGAGTVIDVTTLARWGLTVEIRHAGGFITMYSHLSRATVKIGQPLMRGQVVGFSGASGTTTGPQVYYTLFQNNRSRNPFEFILPDLSPVVDSGV